MVYSVDSRDDDICWGDSMCFYFNSGYMRLLSNLGSRWNIDIVVD